MFKIYSDVEKGLLLHTIHKKSDFIDGRIDISPECEYLQVCSLTLPNNKTFRPHKHIYYQKITTICQESWVVISGKVRVFLYDLDDQMIVEEDLIPGDLTITYRGAHNYLSLEKDTLVYEFKTGPYFGIEKDKEFIDGE